MHEVQVAMEVIEDGAGDFRRIHQFRFERSGHCFKRTTIACALSFTARQSQCPDSLVQVSALHPERARRARYIPACFFKRS